MLALDDIEGLLDREAVGGHIHLVCVHVGVHTVWSLSLC